MQSHELYKRYRQRVEQLADAPGTADLWLSDLQFIIEQFTQEVTNLQPKSAIMLCEDLCDQLEHEALWSTRQYRRDVLMGAVKSFEAVTIVGVRTGDSRH